MRKKLTAKQQRFVEEYLVDFNATQAAIRAKYSEKTAYAIGVENLKKPQIKKAIKAAQQQLSKRTELTQEWVIENLQKNLTRAMQQEPVLDREGNPTGEYNYQGSVANKALELIGKHLGMFSDKLKVGGDPDNQTPIPLSFMTPEEAMAFIAKA